MTCRPDVVPSTGCKPPVAGVTYTRVVPPDDDWQVQVIQRAALIVMNARPDPKLPPVLADLEDSEKRFLQRHVDDLRRRGSDPGWQKASFTAASDMPKWLRHATADDDARFLRASEAFAIRLRDSMKIATNPKQGIFVVATTLEGSVTRASLLKLDADVEVARWKQLTTGSVRLSVLEKCLPGPGHVQKGASWPDDRLGSDMLIADRNRSEAQYFLSALQLSLAPKVLDTEKALTGAIVKLPAPQRKKALEVVAGRSGNAEDIIKEIKEVAPEFDDSRAAFGGNGRPVGSVRKNHVHSRQAILKAGDVSVSVPVAKMDEVVSEPVRRDDGWEVTVRFPQYPQWQQ